MIRCLKDEGRLDQTTGKIKDAVERVIDKAKNTVKRPATSGTFIFTAIVTRTISKPEWPLGRG